MDSLILTFADNVVKEETKGEEREIVIERKKQQLKKYN